MINYRSLTSAFLANNDYISFLDTFFCKHVLKYCLVTLFYNTSFISVTLTFCYTILISY